MSPPKPPRPNDLPRAIAGDEQPEKAAVLGHPGLEGAHQDPPRRTTLTGIAVPGGSGELAPTLPAPNPLRYTTVQRPPPPSSVAKARRSDPPTTLDSSEPPGATTGQPDGSASAIEDLRQRLAASHARVAELERRARVRDETDSPAATFPPPVRTQTPVPSSTAKADQAIGAGLRVVLGKLAPYLFAAAGIGGGVTAVAKPSVDPAKTEAVLASQEAMRADIALLREQVAGMLKREAARDQYAACLEETLNDVGEQLLPAQDRLVNAAPLRAYVKRCARLRP